MMSVTTRSGGRSRAAVSADFPSSTSWTSYRSASSRCRYSRMSALSSATRIRPAEAGASGPATLAGTGAGAGAGPGSQRSASPTNASDVAVGALPDAVSATRSGSRCAVPVGIRTVKVVPVPGVLAAVIVPPCRVTSSRVMASPMPDPSVERARVPAMRWNRSNSRGSSSAGIPAPVSATVSSTALSPSARRATATWPSRVNFSALDSRLRTTFSQDSRSTWTGHGSGGQSTV